MAFPSRGHIDFYGYDPAVTGYILGGWASETLLDLVRAGRVTLSFDDGELSGGAVGASYPRPALGDLGTGIVIVVPAAQPRRGRLQEIRLGEAGGAFRITPSLEAASIDAETLHETLAPILPHVTRTLPRAILRQLAPELMLVRGAIDLSGSVDGTRVVCGWAPVGRLGETVVEASWVASGQTVTDQATLVLHEREGLEGQGLGLLLLMPDGAGKPGHGQTVPGSVRFLLDGETVVLTPTPSVQPLDGARLRDVLRPLLTRLERGHAYDRLRRLAAPRGYRGGSTLDQLSDFLRLEIDEAILCPPDGLILQGWLLAHPDTVESLWLHSGGHATQLAPERWVSIARGGVIDEIGQAQGLTDPRCGFIALIPEGHAPEASAYLEVRTRRGEVAYRDVPPPRLSGKRAIETLLHGCDFQYADVAQAFDQVLGPAIRRLNQARLTRPPTLVTIRFGAELPAPRCSVIVPLYRRLDYMDAQIGLFAVDPPGAEVELIYVLDDPPLRREAENLAALLHARHGVPITLICLGENLGFAPASNIGLQAARGDFVCLLNSDVFAQGPGWLDRLCDRLTENPSLGVVGPMLVYEDGSVQHRGMSFRRLPQYGGWFFGDHPGKGLKPEPGSGLDTCISITGACMVLSSALALQLGGFDEGFVIGDFEDSDLCLRIQELGLGCAVDLGERLYHLERKSQDPSSLRWRMNLTVYNAWFHQQRWGQSLSRMVPDLA